jgi:hypothetical protein
MQINGNENNKIYILENSKTIEEPLQKTTKDLGEDLLLWYATQRSVAIFRYVNSFEGSTNCVRHPIEVIFFNILTTNTSKSTPLQNTLTYITKRLVWN